MSSGEIERLKRLVAEAVGDERMVLAPPYDGLGGVIINAPESDQALLWIRGGAEDDQPALIQAMVPFDERPVSAPLAAIMLAVTWLEAQAGRWEPQRAEDG